MRIEVEGGYADMVDGGMVDGYAEISCDIYTDDDAYVATVGWALDPTDYHQNGIPSFVNDDIQEYVTNGDD